MYFFFSPYNPEVLVHGKMRSSVVHLSAKLDSPRLIGGHVRSMSKPVAKFISFLNHSK